MIAWLKRMRRRAKPFVTIEVDVFAPDGRRSLVIQAPWIRK